MLKWYEDNQVDEDIVLSSRIRLARNLDKYLYSVKINKKESERLVQEVKESMINERNPLANQFWFSAMDELEEVYKHELMEKHIISPDFLNQTRYGGVLAKEDESVSILINEEDHIRLQTILPANQLMDAWELADKIDNLMEESVGYAFDSELGYLTSCPTNTGTGLRASLMMHLPILQSMGQIPSIAQSISQFGLTVRGTYGEGSNPVGCLYQISNQITIGFTEEEIIKKLLSVSQQIIDKEKHLQKRFLEENRNLFEDKIYRAYGLIKYARVINAEEGMSLLSDIRLGVINGILKNPVDKTIYSQMMNIQPGAMEKSMQKEGFKGSIDLYRSNYLRSIIC